MGAFRDSPIIDILSEAVKVPLKIRTMHLSELCIYKHLLTERSFYPTLGEENRTPIL